MLQNNKVIICSIPNLIERELAEDFGRTLREFIYVELSRIVEGNQKREFILAKNAQFLRIFKRDHSEKINNTMHTVSSFIGQLEEAIAQDGIKQKDLFSIYPIYFEYHLLRNEHYKLVYFTSNSKRCHEIAAIKYTFESQLAYYETPKRKEYLFEMFLPLLKSDDYLLIASLLMKRLNLAFQKELSGKLLEKEALLKIA